MADFTPEQMEAMREAAAQQRRQRQLAEIDAANASRGRQAGAPDTGGGNSQGYGQAQPAQAMAPQAAQAQALRDPCAGITDPVMLNNCKAKTAAGMGEGAMTGGGPIQGMPMR